jgi:exonuclease III
VCMMKIISWNIRGLGGMVKRKEVRKLVGEKFPSIVCLQETKLALCDDFLCSSLWGNSPHAFSFRPSVGASRGLLTIWDPTKVEVWSSVRQEHVLWCHGQFLSSGEEFHVANVYGPCDNGARQRLWDSLSVRIQSLGGQRVCVCGDFNAVRHPGERRSPRTGLSPSDNSQFNRFIDDNFLVDLPMYGRIFTWYKGDGLTMSRLDRFLLSKEWCLTWPNCTQTAQVRGISDHFPLS